MGLRSWILKPYLDELGNLEERFGKIDASIQSLITRLTRIGLEISRESLSTSRTLRTTFSML